MYSIARHLKYAGAALGLFTAIAIATPAAAQRGGMGGMHMGGGMGMHMGGGMGMHMGGMRMGFNDFRGRNRFFFGRNRFFGRSRFFFGAPFFGALAASAYYPYYYPYYYPPYAYGYPGYGYGYY